MSHRPGRLMVLIMDRALLMVGKAMLHGALTLALTLVQLKETIKRYEQT